MTRIHILSDSRDLLGESPLWDERTQSLYWIDGRAPRVRRRHLASGTESAWAAPSHIGAIALCESGRLLLALEAGFALLDPGQGSLQPFGPPVAHAAPRMRLNDGRCDRGGRFVVGSMTLGRHEPHGAVHQLWPDGTLRTLDQGVRVANATCFSPDGRWMYFADTPLQQLRRYPYDPATGACGAAEVFLDSEALGGLPDGAAVDAEGGIWIALVLAGRLVRFSPDGELLQRIDFPPDSYITCPCFGGPALDQLFLTSIRDSGNLLRSQHPQAGAVFVVEGAGVRGLPESRFDDRQTAAAPDSSSARTFP